MELYWLKANFFAPTFHPFEGLQTGYLILGCLQNEPGTEAENDWGAQCIEY